MSEPSDFVFTPTIKAPEPELGFEVPPGAPCDLVFLDPPYGKSLGHQALRSAWAQGWIAAEAWIVFEEASAMTPEGFVLRDSRKFGGTTMTFLQPIQEAAASEPGEG